ncbi:hypothetical protein IFM89_014126 [Coptis chinensis]|uniref:Non-lysosomal glucosylceramidase n=1 Tax=Coptis chinensis TaxID=261450 RepID=A0A835HQJ2_9MAGN|nr:hypothetical protein IFM89_014126 [Coptis chinensis]
MIDMVSGNIFHCRKHSWPSEEYISKTTLQLFDFDSAAPPKHAWRRRLNSHANILKEFSVTFMEALKMMRLGVRLWSYVREEASQGRKAPIDPFTRESCKPSASQGVQLGGMGSGSISRGFRGEFRQLQIVPGLCEASPIMANQFSVNVLSSSRKSDGQGTSSWGWNLSGQHSTYHALFPRAWTIYDGEPDPELKVSCRQISPFIPNNYRDSSLPAAVFVYTLVNTGKERAKVSLLLTWANSIGGTSHLSGDHFNEPFMLVHVICASYEMRRRWSIWCTSTSQASCQPLIVLVCWTAKDNPPVTFAIAACETQNVDVTVLPCFGLTEQSHVTAKDMWGTMVQGGHFDRENINVGRKAYHRHLEIHFVRQFQPRHGRYTKFYGTSERSAVNLVHDALMNYKQWEEEIEKWQNPILRDDSLPEWYKFTLFNELYFLVAGGTVWIDGHLPAADDKSNLDGYRHKLKDVDNLDAKIITAKVNVNQGVVVQHDRINGFSSKELDRINGFSSNGVIDENEDTYQGSLHSSESVDLEETRRTNSLHGPKDDDEDVGRFLYLEGVEYIMWCTYDVHFYASFALLALFPKIELSIQRDFAKAVLSEDGRKVKFLADGTSGIRKARGAVPHDLGTHDPWHEMNAYNIHNTSRWKDLNPKFVLQVYRDFAATGNMSFAVDVWPAVCAAIEYMEQFDKDGDGLIENDGFPDQTYDAWTVHGISAYCGCLWLAALEAAAAMAHQLGDKAFAERCRSKFLKAKPVFEEKLWNGSYFNYDSGSSSNSRSIQADQLAGQWWTESCMQSREIWTGVTYGLAATMILTEMKDEAFTTAEGIFTAGWSEEGSGYWFQTPEGWTVDGHYRSLIYMRPLAIWAMQWALALPKSILQAPGINMMDKMYTSSNGKASTNDIGGVRKLVKKTKCFSNAVFHCSC